MKSFLGLLAALTMMASMAQASSFTTVRGHGFANGACTGGSSFQFCANGIQDRAERDTRFNAENQCRARRGRLQSMFPNNCFTNCNPTFPPPNGQFVSVICNADCSYTCLIN